jgi:hypothetical protein
MNAIRLFIIFIIFIKEKLEIIKFPSLKKLFVNKKVKVIDAIFIVPMILSINN